MATRDARSRLVEDFPRLRMNLLNLCELTGESSQAAISERCGIEAASLNRYISGASDISLRALLSICSRYGFDADEFIYDDLSAKRRAQRRATAQAVAYEMYEGSYLCTFRCAEEETPLKYLVVSLLCEGEEAEGASRRSRAVARLFYDRERAVEQLRAAQAAEEGGRLTFAALEAAYPDAAKRYYGAFQVSGGVISVELSSVYYEDRALILLPDSRKNKRYIGGLGTVNSAVRTQAGSRALPCAQLVLVSRWEPACDDDALCELLAVGEPAEAHADWSALARRVLTLCANAREMELSQEDLALVVGSNLRAACSQQLAASRPPFAAAELAADKQAYEIIKASRPESAE